MKNEQLHSLSPEHVIIGIVDPVSFSWNTANTFFIFSLFVVYLYFVVIHFCGNKTMLQPPDLFFSSLSFSSSSPARVFLHSCCGLQAKSKLRNSLKLLKFSLLSRKQQKSLGMLKPLPAWNRSWEPCLFSHHLGIQLTEESHLLAATFILAVKKDRNKSKAPIYKRNTKASFTVLESNLGTCRTIKQSQFCCRWEACSDPCPSFFGCSTCIFIMLQLLPCFM